MGVTFTNMNGEIVYTNASFCEITGYAQDELVGRSIQTMMHPEDLAVDVEVVADLRSGKKDKHVSDKRYLHKSGTYILVSSAISIATVPGTTDCLVVGQVRDVSEERRVSQELATAMERAQAADRAKSQFLANVSHEIRTPMNGILGMAQVLGQTPMSDHQQAMLDIMSESGNSLVQIMNDILDISKIEAGKLELEKVEFDLNDILNSVSGLWRLRAEEKGLALTLETTPEVCRRFVGDPTRIRQVLGNIVSNAIKFTETGAVVVRVAEESGMGEATNLLFEVADTGPGISPEALDRLFTPFTQADESVTRRYGGTGLGLAISRQLCEMMGGRISATSTLGEGSCFQFQFSVRSPETAAAPNVERAQSTVAGDRPVHILIAEDNMTNRMVLDAMLSRTGAVCTMVENGQKALEAWERERFDLVLMDVQMPVMNGIDATRLLRSREASLSRPHTPVIGVTANVMAHQIKDYTAAGMDDHLAKPIHAPTLYEKVLALTSKVQEPRNKPAA